MVQISIYKRWRKTFACHASHATGGHEAWDDEESKHVTLWRVTWGQSRACKMRSPLNFTLPPEDCILCTSQQSPVHSEQQWTLTNVPCKLHSRHSMIQRTVFGGIMVHCILGFGCLALLVVLDPWVSEHLVVLGVWWKKLRCRTASFNAQVKSDLGKLWHPWSCHVIRDYIFVVAVLLLLLRFKENHLTSWTPFVTKPFPQYQETPPMCCLWCLRCQQCLTVRNQTLLVTTVNGRLSRKY